MHLKFCFENIPIKPTPAAMLRYYRVRKGLTTRQLAESVGIVPATLLMYENEKFPIPPQTATNLANILKIEPSLLFDEFARFIVAPYSERLQSIRKTYGVSQKSFATNAGINFCIYAKWECGTRSPSRKMYQQMIETYPEIKV